MARCLSRKLLEKVDFSIWDDEDIDRGLDGLMTRKLSKIGMIPIPYGEEVWLELDGSIYGSSRTYHKSGYHQEDARKGRISNSN